MALAVRLSFLAALLIPLQADAWGEDGHIIVSKIAEAHLKPATRAALKEIFEDRSISDPRICTWADQIRRSAVYNRKYPNHDTWHYINIELQVKADEFKPEASQNHVIAAIDRLVKVAKHPDTKPEDRKEALMFVIHFMEDFHQPLHTGNREDDKGGNLQPIKSYHGVVESKLNLHKVWDVNLVKSVRGELTNDDFAKRLLDEIKEEEIARWHEGDVKKWVWESHEIVVKTVYKFTDGKELPKPDGAAVELTEENYIKEKRPIVREQLKKAGIRLAKVLNESLDAKK